MADPLGSGNSDKDIDNVLVALKKGAQLLKYGRKGKPKFCPFRLSNDESSLIWISNGGEKVLKLATVSKIVPGQRTVVFQRYLCRDKEYLSFSLIYDSGRRSLDLICKDKVEAEAWFAGLKTLIASSQSGRSKIDGWSEDGMHFDDSRDISSNSFSDSSTSTSRDSFSPNSSPHLSNLPKISTEKSSSERSDAANMHVKGASSDVFRVSVSSLPSTSSHGSAPDESDSLWDVYLWGEIINDTYAKVNDDKFGIPFNRRTDVLLPRPLESNTVLDVQYLACGVRHAALITRQGEVFTWGEESGGRLGHGVGTDVTQPCLVESLSSTTSDYVACGEFHTCAINYVGELYTWGDGSHHAGLLGHGNNVNVSHCIPRRVSGPLDGLQVTYVSCGVWHTALITSAGQLFTFGDGTFGVLGHGNRENAAYPREVESLTGLRTVSVACGVWHTAAIVEVFVTQTSTLISGKLFTWGDGDKYRLGHGDKDTRLKPTCVPSLIDHNFHRLACGHSLTVGLNTSGRVFTMGSTVYGQLGNSYSDGKSPCLVEDKLAGECVDEIACGSYHVAVLTVKNEVYTWGKGSNGRLGHGDIEDRKTPTLVEALKDRPVKHISCGSNFTAAICQHKWVSGAEQSQCSSCRLAFGFTRKRHNCYNCGLVFCHSCSSKKATRAALSPNPAKPYRVCDSCYVKLKVVESSGISNKKGAASYLRENKDKYEKADTKPSKPVALGTMGTKAVYPWATPGSNSRAASPLSVKSGFPLSAIPSSTVGIENVTDSLKEVNDNLNKEVQKLRAEVESLMRRCEQQEDELQKSELKADKAMAFAENESTKSKAAKQVIKSLTAQLNDMNKKLSSGFNDGDDSRPVDVPASPKGINLNSVHQAKLNRSSLLSEDSCRGLHVPSRILQTRMPTTMPNQAEVSRDALGANETSGNFQNLRISNYDESEDNLTTLQPNSNGRMSLSGSRTEMTNLKGPEGFHSSANGFKSGIQTSSSSHQVEKEWLEQYEPGVYITLVALQDGTRDLRRVRFSRRRFGENQAETWWSENRDEVYKTYNIRPPDKSSAEPFT